MLWEEGGLFTAHPKGSRSLPKNDLSPSEEKYLVFVCALPLASAGLAAFKGSPLHSCAPLLPQEPTVFCSVTLGMLTAEAAWTFSKAIG